MSTLSAGLLAPPLAGRWMVAADASSAGFAVRDKLVTTVRGTLPVLGGGAVVSEEGAVSAAWVELSVAGIATGNAHRDKDLRTSRFLDEAGHPTVRVAVDRATLTDTGWTATAVLTARGRRAPLDVTIVHVAGTPSEVRLQVTGRLDRSPLGIKVPTFIIGRFVDVVVDLTVRRV